MLSDFFFLAWNNKSWPALQSYLEQFYKEIGAQRIVYDFRIKIKPVSTFEVKKKKEKKKWS